MSDYSKAKVRSLDGTLIAYRQYGAGGPGLVLVHGGMKAAQHFHTLATALAGDFSVYVPDRRGRGMSGPHGPGHGVAREVEDLQALLAGAGARFVFGLSAGALITLRTALATPAVERIALFEPPLSIAGSVPTAWLPRYERELDSGRRAAALVTAMKALPVEPLFTRVPRLALTPMLALGLRAQPARPDETTIADLVPTQRYDMRLVQELADTLPDYAALAARVLLLGGTRSPAFFTTALAALAETLPDARRRTLDGLTHEGPEDDGRPAVVAEVLRDFFS
ncbi:alpha/beta hydrolase [Dactylosporangium sp. NPDC049140]|uniref:alpha/beta fold hydrolase n=1 Tax=Dactylosporangium sp. NPDC049140 TaxID=3155647 RepID=UPI0033C5F948